MQKYKDGGIKDARVFYLSDGLTWQDAASRTHTRSKDELKEWIGDRAQAGVWRPRVFAQWPV